MSAMITGSTAAQPLRAMRRSSSRVASQYVWQRQGAVLAPKNMNYIGQNFCLAMMATAGPPDGRRHKALTTDIHHQGGRNH